MFKVVAVTALLGASGCLENPDARSLADLPQLTAHVEVDVGVPDDYGSQNYLRGSMGLDLSDPTDDCFAVENSASLSLDGVEADYVTRGGSYEDDVHGHTETGCETPSFIVNYPPPPRPLSSIRVEDSSATKRIAIEDFLVNPTITVSGAVRSSMPAVLRVVDSRPLASARVWWRADVVNTYMDQWTVEAANVSTPGEIRFTVPSYSGRGTLMVSVVITEHMHDCSDFAACEITVYGGASLLQTMPTL